MSSLAEAGLDARRRALVEAALRSDPALGEELESIAAALATDVARRFWAEFADRTAAAPRPAAAVLAALERAAGG